MKTLEERLGQRIAGQRRAAGFTQAELAEMVGVQPETISRIETGRRSASLALIVLLSEALGLELYELFHLPIKTQPKDIALEKLVWFASRLSATEIELVLDVGAAMLVPVRRALVR